MARPHWLTVALLLLFVPELNAQNLTAPLVSGSWQSTYHNPAMTHFLPDRLTLGLPGLANDLRLQNVSYSDVFPRTNGRRALDLAAWSAALDDRNTVQNIYSVETLGLALRSGRAVLSAYHRLRVVGEVEYPRELIDLLAFGNAPYLGRAIDIAPGGEVFSFQEVGMGVSYAVTDYLAVAGRVKYLAGTSSVQTAPAGRLTFVTEEENYGLTLDQDLTLNTVGAISYRGIERIESNYHPNRLAPGDLFSGNTGLAIDVGVALTFERIRLNASATDLAAAIDWKEDVTSLRFSGTQTFTGLDVFSDLLLDTVSFASAVDSVLLTFEPTVSGSAFRSEIGATYYLGGEYDVNDRLTAGAMIVLEQRLGETAPAYALTARYAALDWLRVGVNLNHRSGIRTNLGLYAYATPGRFRLFVSSDKLLSLVSTGSTALAGIRLGGSLVLGQPSPHRSSSSFLP